jgi:hypothetical protein
MRDICAWPFLVAIFASFTIPCDALPEPGFIMYGAVTNGDALPLISGTVAWQISSSASAISVAPASVNINGLTFYIATVPFETRSVNGVAIGDPTPNTLPLNPTPTTFARLATVNGTNATVSYASSGTINSFIFGPADRGRIERVDLSVSPPLTFAQWLAEYGLAANSNPNSDPTHKGMTLMQQYIAGLNPNDPNSIFAFVGIQPTLQGVQVQWSSASNEVYSLQQGTSLEGVYGTIQSNIVATPGTNTFLIPTPTNGASIFLRILVNQ